MSEHEFSDTDIERVFKTDSDGVQIEHLYCPVYGIGGDYQSQAVVLNKADVMALADIFGLKCIDKPF